MAPHRLHDWIVQGGTPQRHGDPEMHSFGDRLLQVPRLAELRLREDLVRVVAELLPDPSRAAEERNVTSGVPQHVLDVTGPVDGRVAEIVAHFLIVEMLVLTRDSQALAASW